MLRAAATFENSMAEAGNLTVLHDYLTTIVKVPFSFDDLLRSQIVYALSAFDKLLHDLIRIGMVEMYTGRRVPTGRYHSEPITMQFHSELLAAGVPPKEILFEQEVVRKLSRLSFQDPDKVADGLSLIWNEEYKWTKIAEAMGRDPQDVKVKLRLIASRRNAIVHESDIHPITGAKTSITKADTTDILCFLQTCGGSIAKLVK
jgi:hypothetical protein